MRRRALTALGLCALAVGAYAATPVESTVDAAVSAKSAKRTASVRVSQCVRSDVLGRSTLFTGRMRAVKGTERMGMRFTLQSRVGRGSFHTVMAPELAKWHKSKSGVRRFTYRQRVEALEEGVVYRAVVRYRWYDADGHRIRSGKRRSRGCDQRPDMPNLRPIRIYSKSLSETSTLYTVRVANYGKVGAMNVPVELSIDGRAAAPLTVDSIPAGAVVAVRFRGPNCHTQVQARVDPDDTIHESREHDNSRGASCPLS
jgi:hypothetical protein